MFRTLLRISRILPLNFAIRSVTRRRVSRAHPIRVSANDHITCADAHLEKKKIRSAPCYTTRRMSTVICGVTRTQIRIL